MQPPYSQAEMQLYFRLAKSINPRLNLGAQKLLFLNYKRLRLEDATPGSQSAYRITVRQLEALVRLSEALARVHLSKGVTAQHVKEATRLLKNSIIGLESPDLLLDNEDSVPQNDLTAFDRLNLQDEQKEDGYADGAQEDDKENRIPASTSGAGEGQEEKGDGAPQTSKISQRKLNYIKYILLSKLREIEQGTSAGENLVPTVGLTQDELIQHYFQEQVKRGRIQQKDLDMEFQIVAKVIQYLIKKDGSLLVIETPEMNPDEDPQVFKQREQMQRVIAANPNYVIDT
eukprot:TRINITY_DN5979_c0_g1_i1.p1 TRINITY_DN5979_c0_g1~~TRINITY_DN5979_c0_g1_i1.p1  ORF type:complete len:287 (+),score=36.68 TRINITY_DN5979_c0_g1_i1:134-994(+)